MKGLNSNDALLESDQSDQSGQPKTDDLPAFNPDEKTVVRVPVGEAWCELAKAEADGMFYWIFWAENGRAIAICAKGYKNIEGARTSFQEAAAQMNADGVKIAVAYLPKKPAA